MQVARDSDMHRKTQGAGLLRHKFGLAITTLDTPRSYAQIISDLNGQLRLLLSIVSPCIGTKLWKPKLNRLKQNSPFCR